MCPNLLSNQDAAASNQKRGEVNPMRPKIMIAGAVVVAFLLGAAANGIYSATTRAFNPAEEKSIASEVNRQSAIPASRTHFVQPRTVYVSNPVPEKSRVSPTQKKRTFQKEALIVGGSAGAGAAIGAVAGGKKGAALGAVSGGVAGLIYDLATR
jgi:hypothetical protein